MLPFEDRYSRQRRLVEVGPDGQRRLEQTELVLAGHGAKVRWKATHRAPGFAEPVVFADEEITLGP